MTCNHFNQDFLQHQRCIQLNKPEALLETCRTLGAQLPLGLITMTTSCPMSWSFIHVCECVFCLFNKHFRQRIYGSAVCFSTLQVGIYYWKQFNYTESLK